MEKLLEKIAIGIMVLAIASPVVMAVDTTTTTIPQASVTATANVVALCGVEAAPNINFNNLVPGETSGTSTVTVTNDGLSNTDSTDVTVEGINWDDGGVNTMPVGQTEYDDGVVADWTALTASPVTIFGGVIQSLPNTNYKTIDFHVKIPGNQPVGQYTQTITFTLECNV